MDKAQAVFKAWAEQGRREQRNEAARIKRWVTAGWVQLTPQEIRDFQKNDSAVAISLLDTFCYECREHNDEVWLRGLD